MVKSKWSVSEEMVNGVETFPFNIYKIVQNSSGKIKRSYTAVTLIELLNPKADCHMIVCDTV